MEIELDTSKNAMQNLSLIYGRLKEAKAKRSRILEAIEQTKKIGKAQAKPSSKNASKSKFRKKKKWWDEYRSFETSNGFRVVAGKNAKQNDELYAKHLSSEDLFFHADIQGAPTVILKRGEFAEETDILECAQWAASYSSAWKSGAAAVDVYAVEKSQVSKHAQGGYIGRGAFAIEGERKWFRKTELKLKIGKSDGLVLILPFMHEKKPEKFVGLRPGEREKEDAAKVLSAHLSCKKDEVLQLLPNGKISFDYYLELSENI